MTGTLHANTIQKANGDPVELTKQWANTARIQFDQTGTISITDSENCSSVTDHGTGDATVNFTNSHGTAGYSFTTAAGDSSNSTGTATPRTDNPSTSSLRTLSLTYSVSVTDVAHNAMMISGDLA